MTANCGTVQIRLKRRRDTDAPDDFIIDYPVCKRSTLDASFNTLSVQSCAATTAPDNSRLLPVVGRKRRLCRLLRNDDITNSTATTSIDNDLTFKTEKERQRRRDVHQDCGQASRANIIAMRRDIASNISYLDINLSDDRVVSSQEDPSCDSDDMTYDVYEMDSQVISSLDGTQSNWIINVEPELNVGSVTDIFPMHDLCDNFFWTIENEEDCESSVNCDDDSNDENHPDNDYPEDEDEEEHEDESEDEEHMGWYYRRRRRGDDSSSGSSSSESSDEGASSDDHRPSGSGFLAKLRKQKHINKE